MGTLLTFESNSLKHSQSLLPTLLHSRSPQDRNLNQGGTQGVFLDLSRTEIHPSQIHAFVSLERAGAWPSVAIIREWNERLSSFQCEWMKSVCVCVCLCVCGGVGVGVWVCEMSRDVSASLTLWALIKLQMHTLIDSVIPVYNLVLQRALTCIK